MADADEDIIPRSQPSFSSSTADPSADPEDEAADFRFLTALTSSKSSSLPKRGDKDFEPNPTQAQSHTLAASREAMHHALSVERVLPPRNPLVGQYLPDAKDWRWDVIPGADGRGGKGGRCVVVEKFRTTFGRSIGVADYRNWSWLLPEEALFLLERGTLDIRWPDENVKRFMKAGGAGAEDVDGSNSGSPAQDDEKREGVDDDGGLKERVVDVDIEDDAQEDDAIKPKRSRNFPLQVGEMPMSLQGAYASFIGKGGLTLEHYNVYAGLRRLGYIVKRASTWDDGETNIEDTQTNGHVSRPSNSVTQPLLSNDRALQLQHQSQTSATSLINRLVAYLFTAKPLQYRPSTGPLLYPGLYRSYIDVFRALTTIPCHLPSPSTPTPTPPSSTTPHPKPPFSISWLIHKPSPNTQYRKSAPPPPDFRVAVLDARTSTIPTAVEIGQLLDSMPRDELPATSRMEQRLKHGVRNVVLAIVDCGLVSYLRLADMCSGSEGRVVETKLRRGGKGGRGGARGAIRGGGAGRGGRR